MAPAISADLGVWLDPHEQAVWQRLLAVKAHLVERLDRELHAGHGLGLGDYEVLVHLADAPERSLRMTELAARLSLSPSGLTRRVDNMVRRSLVERKPCETDGRGSYASLTEAGSELLTAAAPTHVAGVRRYLIDPLGADRLAALFDGLAPIEQALERH